MKLPPLDQEPDKPVENGQDLTQETATWQPARGTGYRAIAWTILVIFGLCVLGMIAVMIESGFRSR